MRTFSTTAARIALLSMLAGCFSANTATTVCRVADAANNKPIKGARVWEQPYAPIHPFWPSGDHGVTDENGEVKLHTPDSFYFYFQGVDADGYTELSKEEYEKLRPPSDSADWHFYMKRIATADHLASSEPVKDGK